MTLQQSLRDFAHSSYLPSSGGQTHAWEQMALLTPPQRTEPPPTLWNKHCYFVIDEAEWSSEPRSDWLSKAISELEQIDSLAEADGLAPIHESTKTEAKRILEALNPQPIAPVVYPEDDEIVIHFKAPEEPASVGIEIRNDGGGACYSHISGRNRSAHYGAASDIPDVFIRDRLRVLLSGE